VLSSLGRIGPNELMRLWSPACSFAPAGPSVRDAAELVRPDARHDIAIYAPTENRYHVGTFTNRGILAKLSADRSEAWRSLDLAYLHRYMLDELLIAGAMKGKAPSIGYTPLIEEAERMAREALGVAILVKPTAMAELRAVAEAHDFMPQKSTYFYPKLATGLAIHPLA